MKYLFIHFLLLLSTACQKDLTTVSETPVIESGSPKKEFSYLALGDSYTIGQSVSSNGTFPNQLLASLKEQNFDGKVKVIAKTGWTTDELKTAISTAQLTNKYDIVTLLIGVNNQFRGYSKDTYRTEFRELLTTAINFSKSKENVIVLSIPDWGASVYGTGMEAETISKEIDDFNNINRMETMNMSVAYVDITAISRMAATDKSLVANDGLHPSEKMYKLWANLLKPIVLERLNK